MQTESVAEVAAKATKKRVLTDCRVVAEMHTASRYYSRTVEEDARAKEARCKDFNAFIRDHRSQDDIRLDVERIFEDQCTACSRAWETYTENGVTRCANCGAEVEL